MTLCKQALVQAQRRGIALLAREAVRLAVVAARAGLPVGEVLLAVHARAVGGKDDVRAVEVVAEDVDDIRRRVPRCRAAPPDGDPGGPSRTWTEVRGPWPVPVACSKKPSMNILLSDPASELTNRLTRTPSAS